MWCSATGCYNSDKKKPRVSFFRFPKDEERCRRWVQFCRREDMQKRTSTYLYANCRLCANHFEETQFMNRQMRNNLVWNAVPTLFAVPNPPKTLQFHRKPPVPCKPEVTNTFKRPPDSDLVQHYQDTNSSRRKRVGKRLLYRRYLKKDAVPSVFPSASAYLSAAPGKPFPTPRTTSERRLEEERRHPATSEPSSAAEGDVPHCSGSLAEFHSEVLHENTSTRDFPITDHKCDINLSTTVRSEHFANIVETLVKYRERGFLCDAILMAKCGGELKAHSALLSAVSPVFMMYFEEAPSTRPYHIYFPEVELSVLEVAVHFTYTGQLLLPTDYSQKDQLLVLFKKLSDLGLSLQKLSESEMTFMSDDKQMPKKDIKVERAGVENNNHEMVFQDATQELKVTGECSVGEMPSSSIAKSNEINDIAAADAITAMPKAREVLEAIGPVASSSSALAATAAVATKPIKKPALRVLKSLLDNQKTRVTAHPSFIISLPEFSQLSAGLLPPVLDQSVGNIPVLDSDDRRTQKRSLSDCCEPLSQVQADSLNLVNIAPAEETLGPDGIRQPKDAVDIGRQAHTSELCKERNAKTCANEFEMLSHKTRRRRDLSQLCNYCGRRLSSKRNLRHHIKLHLGIRPPQRSKKHGCTECGLHFGTPSLLKDHSLRHTGEKPHECPDCGQRFTLRANMRRHKILHTGYRPFLCNFCGQEFTRKSSLIIHLSQCHGNAHRFECTLCSRKLKDKADMEKHALDVHQLSQLDELSALIKKPQTYLCDMCGKSFASVGSLRLHVKRHRKTPACCETCGKKLSTLYGLQVHMKTHTGERPFVCSFCEKGFIQKTALITHHATHSGIKPFVCVICSKMLSTKVALKQHMMTHTGETPFKCRICSKQFTCKNSLMVHHRIHSGDKPFKCQICMKQFITKRSLTVHVRVHTGDKPYTCTVCGTSFTQSQHLRRHMRTHTGEKPHVCEICGKSYVNKVDLRYHLKRFHKIDVKGNTLDSSFRSA